MVLNFGTGGLVKAYTDSALVGLSNLTIVNKSEGMVLKVDTLYEDSEILKRNIEIFNKNNRKEYVKILDIEYSEKVSLYLFISYDKLKDIEEFKENILKTIQPQHIEKLGEGIA